ncbi:hypothetical protein GCM10010517_03210 [Streptosporangium fragile]|uniref:Asparagine synthase n=1 Tax=Streptosporangium fragile TaxID=46186 RepID=A0ABP6I5H9_9ACTN
MNSSLNIVELRDGRINASPPVREAGIRADLTDTSFELSLAGLQSSPVYYRVGMGRLEWSCDLAAFGAGDGIPVPDVGTLLTIADGYQVAPDYSPIPGVARLPLGAVVQVDGAGVTVSRRQPMLPQHLTFQQAVTEALAHLGDDFAIAYSGGLSSTFLACCSANAGSQPPLLHGVIRDHRERTLPGGIDGLDLKAVDVDLGELLDPHLITGDEPLPPMPEVEVRRRMAAALEREFGGRVVTGALLKDLVSARLGQVEAGVKDWRLLTVEPFHIHGTLRDLAAARELLKDQRVHRPGAGTEDSQPTAAPPPPSPKPTEPPGLTAKASDALASARRGALGVWKDHLDFLDPVLGRALAGLAERGPLATPALSNPVLSSAAALKPAELVRIRKGVLVKHLPLKRALKARGIATVRDASPGFWVRAAAGAYLIRERDKIVRQLETECALADLGLVDPQRVTAVLHDGRELANQVMPLLRLVWLDQWLRKRA